MRPVLGAPLLPRRQPRRQHAGPRERSRRRNARDLEPGLHAVRAGRLRCDDPAAAAFGGHRGRARAPGSHPAGRQQQLRHRPLRVDPEADRTTVVPCLPRRHGARGCPLSGDRRPRPRRHDAGRRRRAALERGPGVRPAPDPATRDALRPTAGARSALPARDRSDGDRGVLGGLLRAGSRGSDLENGGRRHRPGGGALRPDPLRGRGPGGRGDRAPAPRGRDGALRRDGLPLLRHVRHSARGHRGDRGRRGRGGGPGGIRGSPRAAAGLVAGLAEIRCGRRVGLRAAGAARLPLGLPRLSGAGFRAPRGSARAGHGPGRSRDVDPRGRPDPGRSSRTRPSSIRRAGARWPTRARGRGRTERPRSRTCRSRFQT